MKMIHTRWFRKPAWKLTLDDFFGWRMAQYGVKRRIKFRTPSSTGRLSRRSHSERWGDDLSRDVHGRERQAHWTIWLTFGDLQKPYAVQIARNDTWIFRTCISCMHLPAWFPLETNWHTIFWKKLVFLTRSVIGGFSSQKLAHIFKNKL